MRLPRPRISLRWLLIGFTVFTIAFYVVFVRPTTLATRFVHAIEQGHIERAASMAGDVDKRTIVSPWLHTVTTAELSPYHWSDLWHVRRRIVVRSGVIEKGRSRRTGKDYETFRSEHTSLFEAGLFQIRLITFREFDYY